VAEKDTESSIDQQGNRQEAATQVTDSVPAVMSNKGQYDLV
jgi:hypothetical protein